MATAAAAAAPPVPVAPPAPAASAARSALSAPSARELLRHGLCEGLLTAVLLFGVVGIVRGVTGPSALSRGIPQIHLELLLVGAAVGLLLVALILSPPGKASGGHLNPAVTLAMWRFGAFPGRGVVPYAAAQLAGSLLGTLAGRAVFGAAVGRAPVHYAALRPAPGWTGPQLFAAETASMAVIIALVGVFLASPRLARLVPWLVGALVGLAIAVLGTVTGGSVNPARQFGPAIAAGQYHLLWAYLLAPPLGALLAAAALHLAQRRRVPTHHLSGHGRRSSTTMSTTPSNKDIVLNAWTKLFIDRDTSVIARNWGHPYTQHNPTMPDGVDGVPDIIDNLVEGFRYEPGMVMEDGDLVMIHGRYTGWGPKPMITVDIFRLEDGRIVEHWDVMQDEIPADRTVSGHAMFTNPQT